MPPPYGGGGIKTHSVRPLEKSCSHSLTFVMGVGQISGDPMSWPDALYFGTLELYFSVKVIFTVLLKRPTYYTNASPS